MPFFFWGADPQKDHRQWVLRTWGVATGKEVFITNQVAHGETVRKGRVEGRSPTVELRCTSQNKTYGKSWGDKFSYFRMMKITS